MRWMSYRVDVVADSLADAVEGAGGWIFDRVMAGWTVNVGVAESCDTRPIEILGGAVNAPTGHERPVMQVFLGTAAGRHAIEHRPSAAARVFKAQALIAAQLPPMADVREILYIRTGSAIGRANGEAEHASGVPPS